MKEKNQHNEKFFGNALISLSALLFIGFIAYIIPVFISGNLTELFWAIAIVPAWLMVAGAVLLAGILAKNAFFDSEV